MTKESVHLDVCAYFPLANGVIGGSREADWFEALVVCWINFYQEYTFQGDGMDYDHAGITEDSP